MSEDFDRETQYGWEIVEDHGGATTLRCPECGTENGYVKQTAVFKGEVACRECGNTKSIDSPNGAVVLAVFLAAVLIAPIYMGYQRLKGWILDD